MNFALLSHVTVPVDNQRLDLFKVIKLFEDLLGSVSCGHNDALAKLLFVYILDRVRTYKLF